MIDPLKKTVSISLQNASLNLDGRSFWQNVNLEITQGEFVAVLGPNGSGKTSLLRILLELKPFSHGKVEIDGNHPRHGSNVIGYIPQQKAFDPDLPIRGRDLVGFGLDGHRYGPNLQGTSVSKRVDKAIQDVGAGLYADNPVGLLSGGEQQRLRIAQALLGDPKILLCDEPLLSLDLFNQQGVSQLIGQQCRERNTTVVFVTHDINPILPMVDRVLYLVGERWAIGPPQEILTAITLSRLYATPIEVIWISGHLFIFASGESELSKLYSRHSELACARNGED